MQLPLLLWWLFALLTVVLLVTMDLMLMLRRRRRRRGWRLLVVLTHYRIVLLLLLLLRVVSPVSSGSAVKTSRLWVGRRRCWWRLWWLLVVVVPRVPLVIVSWRWPALPSSIGLIGPLRTGRGGITSTTSRRGRSTISLCSKALGKVIDNRVLAWLLLLRFLLLLAWLSCGHGTSLWIALWITLLLAIMLHTLASLLAVVVRVALLIGRKATWIRASRRLYDHKEGRTTTKTTTTREATDQNADEDKQKVMSLTF